MENQSKATENQKDNSQMVQVVSQQPQVPPPKPKWKPNTCRKRKRSLKSNVSQPTDKNIQDAAIGSKKSSWVWGHFKRIVENENYKAVCNYCSQEYAAHPKLHGTGNLINHLEVLCKKYPYRIVDQKQKTLVFDTTLKSVGYCYEESRVKLAHMIIIDELPFQTVEGEGFKSLLASLQPRFTPPSRMTVARDCMKLYFEEQRKVKSLIKSERVCLTTDTWTSIQNINYMCLTAHWIDKGWCLQKRILSFCVIPNHKGKTIGKMIEDRLLDWGIDKLLTITVDNASSNDGAINYLKKNTKSWKTTILDNEFLHLRCCAHILNLIVKDGLKNQNDSVLKIRNAVRYVRSSPARLEAFKKCAKIEKIVSKSLVCLDVETRWNSTYLMLESALKFEKAFERLREDDANYRVYFAFGEKDSDEVDEGGILEDDTESEKRKAKANHIGPPNEDDWNIARAFVKFLKLFFEVTKRFSGSLHVTSNLFLQDLAAVQKQLNDLSKQKDQNVSLMALNMQKKFTKYWESLDKINFLLYAATVLDPRYKMRFVRFCLKQVYGNDKDRISSMEEQVRRVLVRLYNDYQSCNPSQSTQSLPSSSNQAPLDAMDMDDDMETGMSLASQFAKQLEEDESGETKSELSRYLEENCERDLPSFDTLRWWKDNTVKFPILSQIVRDVLAIPVSTVASESAFSTSGRILDPYRSSLNPEMVEALVCCQNWLRSKPLTIDIHEFMKEVPMDEVEKYEEIFKEFRGSVSSTSKSQVLDD